MTKLFLNAGIKMDAIEATTNAINPPMINVENLDRSLCVVAPIIAQLPNNTAENADAPNTAPSVYTYRSVENENPVKAAYAKNKIFAVEVFIVVILADKPITTPNCAMINRIEPIEPVMLYQ